MELSSVLKSWNSDYQLSLQTQNRHNKMEQSVSQISMSSRLGLRSDIKGKNTTSTNLTSKAQDYDSTYTADEEDSIQRPDRAKEIQKRIAVVEQCQGELQAKFQKVIESLSKEIAKREEVNAELEAEISFLRSQLQQSKKDLGIIVGYIAKRKAKATQGENRRVLLNSTKVSGKLDKSVSGGKGEIDMSGKEARQERKNKSPRMLILKKSFKG